MKWMLFVLAALVVASCEFATNPKDRVLSAQAKPAALECKHGCDHAYRGAVHSEWRRHRLMVKNCGGSEVCLDFEATQHAQMLALIEGEHDNCLANCEHQQGAGGGGQ